MDAKAPKPPPLPYNPNMFKWARKWRERTIEEAAKHIGTKPENIQAWERGNGVPTVRQARQMAEYYDRAFVEFFRDEPPDIKESQLVPDFRLHRHAADPRKDREIKRIQSWAEAQRLSAIDLFEIVGDTPPIFPKALFSNIDANPDKIAKEVRKETDLSIEDQLALSPAQRANFPKMIRKALEQLGVLVLKEGELSKYGVRGLCIFTAPLPIMVYGTEAPSAQAFTIAHELGHIVLQQSAISGPPSAKDDSTLERKTERWCDRFAGAFLIPEDAVAEIWAKPNSPLAAIGDETLKDLSNTFKASRHATLIRLMHLGYVDPDYYWNKKRDEFLKEERLFKSFGRPKYYGSRYRSANGDLYTGLVLEAWNSGYITNHNAAEFMGIKNFQHLYDVRDNFLSS